MTPSILMKCHKHQIDQAIAMIAQRVLSSFRSTRKFVPFSIRLSM
jgi:hypothetical protein